MRKSLIKNNLREISKTRRRFLSILVMSFLGVGFFAGLVACGPDMQDSLDVYADENNLYDINIVSTLGLTDEDITEIKKIDKVEEVYGVKSLDVFASIDDEEEICKVIEYNQNVNIPTVISGRLPEKENECVIDARYFYLEEQALESGKKLLINNDDKNTDDEEILKNKEFDIVGIVTSPVYISSERGTASIGDGKVSYFIYVQSGIINTDYYTDVYATIKNSKELNTMSSEYIDLVDEIDSRIEEIKEKREISRYNSLIEEATIKLDDAQAEYDDKKEEAKEEFRKAEKKIRDAKDEVSSAEKKLADGEKELNEKEAEANSQFEDARNKIAAAESQLPGERAKLDIAEKEYNSKLVEANAGLSQLEYAISNITSNINTLNAQKTEVQNTLNTLIEIEENSSTPDLESQATIAGLETSLTQINEGLRSLNAQLSSYTAQKNEIQYQLDNGKLQIEAGKLQLDSAQKQLNDQKYLLETNEQKAREEFDKARKEIEDNKTKLADAKSTLSKNEKEYLEKKADAEKELNDAQDKLNEARDDINKIEKAKWYINKRQDNLGYSNVKDAISTMTNIAKYFPSIFYLIAVLICLTSMTRMIEEERTEIGTLKALGYTNISIISKYIIYVLTACVIGGTVGMLVGFYILPNIVWELYSMLYTIPNFKWEFRLSIGIEGLLLEIICICLATIYVAVKELKNVPARLMRPKPPKKGKAILLEKITFIWKRFNFSQKVVARNIFRYKKRAIITILGIAGCTALMITGFGIKDSVMDITKSEFTNEEAVFVYDLYATLANTDDISKIEAMLDDSQDISDYTKVFAGTCDAEGKSRNYNISLFAVDDIEEFRKQCNLVNYSNGKILDFTNDGVILTDKLAELLDVKVGEKVSIIDSDDIRHEFVITGIAQNYVSNYMFMTKEFYNENIKTFNINMILAKASSDDAEINKVLEELLKFDSVTSVQDTDAAIKSVEDMMSTINSVVVILVVSSALLDLVVLYNLANINIGERQREIATLKVLGFYDSEVDDYINKENIIFTIVGIILGLIFGYFLTGVVVKSVEIERLRFLRKILLQSYIYSAVITFVFSIVVNFIIHFILKKIDMIESLKSVE